MMLHKGFRKLVPDLPTDKMINIIVTILLTTLFIEISHQECTEPFELIGNSCYLFECSDHQMGMIDSWMEAKLRCQLNNGWLAEPQTLKSMRKIHKLMCMEGFAVLSREDTWYVGAFYNTTVGRYTWLSGGVPNTNLWAPKEPQQDVGKCVVMSWMLNDTRRTYLFSEDCRKTTCYICQKNQTNVKDIPRGQHLDNIEAAEIWNHFLNLFELPFKNRTTPRGTNRYIYVLDNETIQDVKHMPIIVPAIPNIIEELGDIVNIKKGESNVPMPFDNDATIAKFTLSKLFTERSHSAKELFKYAINAKDHLNEYIFIEVLAEVMKVKAKVDKEENSKKSSKKKKLSTEEKHDLDGFVTPQIDESFPNSFVNIAKRKDRKKRSSESNCEYQNTTDTRLTGNEWKVSYYREDLELNTFHNNWHAYNKVKKLYEQTKYGKYIDYSMPEYDHGELLYYFHSQIIARYNLERLSNGLAPVESLSEWSGDYIIPENYYPFIDKGSRCGEQNTSKLQEQLGPAREVIGDAIRKGIMLVNGDYDIQYNLTNDKGISLIGCNVETDVIASCPSNDIYKAPFFNMSKGIHNRGHNILGSLQCHGDEKWVPGCMTRLETSLRDPLFYRWHMFLEDLFRMHKKTLSTYEYEKLSLSKVEVTDANVQSVFGSKNELFTFMERKNHKYKVGGLKDVEDDDQGSGCVSQDRLNHRPFTYEIKVRYDGYFETRVNIRIYMAPVYDHLNRKLTFEEQRNLWALMDRFSFELQSGQNIIQRKSCDSSVSVRPLMTTEEIRERINKKFKKSSDLKKDVCPKGFTRVGRQCLQFFTQSAYKDTFGNAQHKCQQRNGRLVIVLDPQNLADTLRKHYRGMDFWVSARKSVEKGIWKWSNMEVVDKDTYPEINFPENDLGLGHNCLAWVSSKQLFTVRKCGEELQYICEAVSQDCRDMDSLCYKWKMNCEKEEWISKNCPKTCGKCVTATPYCTPHPECVFPFTREKGPSPRWYKRCTFDNGYAVCPTSNFIDSYTEWIPCTGVCESTGIFRSDAEDVDPTVCHPHRSCTFPFKYKDVEYTSCTDMDEQFFWCSKKQDEDDYHIRQEWERCTGMCGLLKLKNKTEHAEVITKEMEKGCLTKDYLIEPMPCGPETPPPICADKDGSCFTSCDKSHTCVGMCSPWCYCCATNCQSSTWCSWKGGYCVRNKESCLGIFIDCEGEGCKCCLPKHHQVYGGPTEKLWEENQCHSLRDTKNVTVVECMKKCDSSTECNALSYQISGHNCQILNCPAEPLPKPTSKIDTHIGYYKKKVLPICNTTCFGSESSRKGMCSSLIESLEINAKQEESEDCIERCTCITPKECIDLMEDCRSLKDRCQNDLRLLILCAETCMSCSTHGKNATIKGCMDSTPHCPTLQGECLTDAEVRKMCPETCGSCKNGNPTNLNEEYEYDSETNEKDKIDANLTNVYQDYEYETEISETDIIDANLTNVSQDYEYETEISETDIIDDILNDLARGGRKYEPDNNKKDGVDDCSDISIACPGLKDFCYKPEVKKKCPITCDSCDEINELDSKSKPVFAESTDCKPHQNCTFPYIYKGLIYKECSNVNWDVNWCSTKQDKQGYHIKGHFEQCSKECEYKKCTKHKTCTFPFTYKETTYSNCTDEDASYFWCSTKQDENGYHIRGHWKTCRGECEEPEEVLEDDASSKEEVDEEDDEDMKDDASSKESEEEAEISSLPSPGGRSAFLPPSGRHMNSVSSKYQREEAAFSKDICKRRSLHPMKSLEECQVICNKEWGCNALNSNPQKQSCILFECPMPMPKPYLWKTKYVGYKKKHYYKTSVKETDQYIMDNHKPLNNYVENKGMFWKIKGREKQCQMLSTHFEQSILKCHALCDNNTECNAVNYKSSIPTRCSLIKCPIPLDPPLGEDYNVIGYLQKSLNYKKFSEEFDAGWSKTTKDCSEIVAYDGLDVKQCKDHCNKDKFCNAVNFFKTQMPTKCSLLRCKEPIQLLPRLKLPGLVGFHHLMNCFDLTTGCSKLDQKKKFDCMKGHIRKYCPRTCRECTGDCWDTDNNCNKWDQLGLCSTDKYVQKNCPKTCFNCKGEKKNEELPCQCGLPHHLLIPKGTPEGMPFQIFVYITAFHNDENNNQDPSKCDDVTCSDLCAMKSNCLGYKGQSMGFPFDRPLPWVGPQNIDSIEDLDNILANAKKYDINIFHSTTNVSQSDDNKCHYQDYDETLNLLDLI